MRKRRRRGSAAKIGKRKGGRAKKYEGESDGVAREGGGREGEEGRVG